MARGYIDDGYTLLFEIPETQWHDAVKGEYRPMTNRERIKLRYRFKQCARKDEDLTEEGAMEMEAIADEIISRHVVAWDFKDRENKPVPIKPESISRVERHLAASLFNLIFETEEKAGGDQKN